MTSPFSSRAMASGGPWRMPRYVMPMRASPVVFSAKLTLSVVAGRETLKRLNDCRPIVPSDRDFSERARPSWPVPKGAAAIGAHYGFSGFGQFKAGGKL